MVVILSTVRCYIMFERVSFRENSTAECYKQQNVGRTQNILIRRKIMMVALTLFFFIYPCPCFHLKVNKILLNKTRNALDFSPPWG